MRVRRIVIILLSLFFVSFAQARAETYSTQPPQSVDEKRRVGYLEGGEFPDYQIIFLRTLEGLMELGWIEPMEMPAEYEPDHRRMWEWVADNVRSDYLEFVKNAYYSSDFDADKREQTKQKLLNRLNEQGDLDLILAMGTWAGQDLANNEHATPTVVASTSDPVGSGIVKSAEDSGYDHLHAKVEPDRYYRQVRLFHDIIGFEKLGLVYEDTVEGRTFAAVNEVERVAGERGFELERCFARNSGVTKEQASAEVLECYNELAPQVDALYITMHRGENLDNLPGLLEPLLDHEVATFAMAGSEFVRHGALLSIAHADFSYTGMFHAQTVARILNGAKPRDLEQKWVAPPKIAINLKTAEIIGFNPPFDVLAAADDIFEDIEPVE
ncbi:MAG: ABC transporter substrate-binding protein [Desulfonatronovibrio sp.]